MQVRQKIVNGSFILIALGVCFYPLCYKIDVIPIQLWDESRNVTNAIEMMNNGHWLTRYFEGKPDMWELKPPLLVWCEALSFIIFGFNEMAARMPSMFFAIGTVLLMLWMGYKITGKLYAGALASIILVSCKGYIGQHAARFGDHDAILTFFSTAFLFSIYLFFTTQKSRYLYFVFISLFLGWAAKSITIFMFVPALFLWALVNNQVLQIMANRHFWKGFIITLLLILSYYLIREQSSPGYIQLVWENEFFGRYFGTSKDFLIHKDPFWYYLSGFYKDRFNPWWIFFLAGIIALIINKKIPNRKFLFFLLLNWILFLVLISGGSKNYWYDMPLYPIAALFLGIFIFQTYYVIKEKSKRLTFILLATLFIYLNYSNSLNYVLSPDSERDSMEKLCYFLKDESNLEQGNFKIYHYGYNSPLYLYIENAKSKNVRVKIVRDNKFEKDDRVVVADPNLILKLDSIYINHKIATKQGCEVRQIIKPK